MMLDDPRSSVRDCEHRWHALVGWWRCWSCQRVRWPRLEAAIARAASRDR
jgi:hypothetical protein